VSESHARWVVIEPTPRWPTLGLRELWAHRELLYFLTWRDVKVRYKQTLLGVGWAILQPLATMLVFALFFGRLAKMPSDGVPYPLFSLAALVPWTFFANGMTQSATSVVLNQNLVTKVYFPRLAIPSATVLAGVFDFVLAFVLLLAFIVWYGVTPSLHWLMVVPFSVLALAATLGVGMWLGALNVQYRDVRYAVPFLVQLWLFATPIAYPSSLLTEPWRTVYALNPMVAVVDGFRWSLLATRAPSLATVATSCAVALLLLVSGTLYFRRMEQSFADVV
jgi:lipopolysaccharide transport system permease protein